jgi:hypothetical protein
VREGRGHPTAGNVMLLNKKPAVTKTCCCTKLVASLRKPQLLAHSYPGLQLRPVCVLTIL